MIRKITCKNCKKEFSIKSDSNSRHELENERGRYFHTKCDHCQEENEYHVNEVKADIGSGRTQLYIVGGITLFILATLYFFKLGLVWAATLAIPFFVYLNLKANAEKSVQLFNMGEISITRPT